MKRMEAVMGVVERARRGDLEAFREREPHSIQNQRLEEVLQDEAARSETMN